MALESGTYISDLVTANPASTDQKSKGDDHLRLIKATIKNTFPSITGVVNATQAELNKLAGATITTAELNNLHGVTSSTAELNLLDGAVVSTTEINYLAGVTSSVQTQINTKAAKAGDSYTGAHNFSGASGVTLPAATSIGAVSAAEIVFLDGVTSPIQTQFANLDAAKADIAGESYSGVHDFTGATSITVPTRNVGTSGAYAASVDFVNASLISANSSLPGQVGNAGKFLKTDGTNPSWAYVMAYVTKSAGFTASTGDSGSMFDCTGSWTLSLTAAATLGSSWYCYVKNSGSGTITLDPNASEQIDGAAISSVYPGQTALIVCTGTAFTSVVRTVRFSKLPILSAAAASRSSVTVLEDLSPVGYSTGLAAGASIPKYGAALFVAYNQNSDANVATSAEGKTWTLRAMPSSQMWRVGTNGTDKFLATIPSGTTTANSTTATSWASATALPGTSHSSYCVPAFNGNVCLVRSQTASTVYRSTDNGATWTTETTPAALGDAIYAVGGLFWYWASATTAYTSPTGLTGSWTSRTLPVAPTYTYFDSTGYMRINANSAGGAIYETIDGINWTNPGGLTTPSGIPVVTINGVSVAAGGGTPYTLHAGAWVQRRAASPINNSSFAFSPTAACFVGATGYASTITFADTTPTGIFEG